MNVGIPFSYFRGPEGALKQKNHRRKAGFKGAALATLLMVVAIALILAFTLAGTSLFHLTLAVHAENSGKAHDLAESVIAQAIEKIIKNQEYGINPEPPVVIYPDNKRELGSGLLTFSRDYAEKNHLPLSTNNIPEKVSTKGWRDRVIPPNSVHLVGTGESNGVVRTIEVIIHVPLFPYCIASEGKFISEGELLVGSVNSSRDISGGIDTNSLLPGNMVSNNGDNDSITLLSDGEIIGDLQTAGGLEIGPHAKINILGEIRRHAEKASIPSLDILSYDPAGKEGLNPMPGYLENPSLQGYCRCSQSMSIVGDLNLLNSILYVNGDLSVTGAVKGKGALVVTGKTTIKKGADLSSDNLVALLSHGDVDIGMDNPSGNSAFQGIIYTESNFTAHDVSIAGVFLNKGGISSQVKLTNVRMVDVPDYSVVECNLGVPGNYVTFHYANNQNYPMFKLIPLPVEGGGYDFRIVNLTTNPNDHYQKKRVCDNLYGVVAYFDEWWEYCENNKLYGAGMDRDDGWDIDSGGTIDWSSPADRIRHFMEDRLKAINFTVENGYTPRPVFNLDLSRFIGIEDRMQTILWKEL